MPGTFTSMPNCAVPFTFDGVSRRRVRLPTMRKALGSFSGGFSGTGMLAALAASSPKVAFRPLGPVMTPLPALTSLRSTFQRAAAAVINISRTCAPPMRSLSQPSRTDVEPPVSCGPPSNAFP
jgi:hypothetical protein